MFVVVSNKCFYSYIYPYIFKSLISLFSFIASFVKSLRCDDSKQDTVVKMNGSTVLIDNINGFDKPPNKALPSVPCDRNEAPQRSLPQVPGTGTDSEYSYVSNEFRTMSFENDAPVDKTDPQNDSNGYDYSYVPVTSRSITMGMTGGNSIPVRTEKALIDFSSSGNAEEEVPITRELDPENPDEFLHTTINDDVYALVNKPPKYPGGSSGMTGTKQQPTRTSSTKQAPTSASGERRSSSYDIVSDPVINPNIENLYAAVQKPPKTTNTKNIISHNKPRPFNNANMLAPFNNNNNSNNNMIYPAGFKPSKKKSQ